jgi:hypothetical protein
MTAFWPDFLTASKTGERDLQSKNKWHPIPTAFVVKKHCNIYTIYNKVQNKR